MAIVEVYLIEAPSEEGAVTEGDWGSSSVNECYFLQVTVKSKFETQPKGEQNDNRICQKNWNDITIKK